MALSILSRIKMEELINLLIKRFQVQFPDYVSYSPLIKNAVTQRTQSFELVMSFYRNKKDHQRDLGRLADLNEACAKTLRASILQEAAKNTPASAFAMATFCRLNKQRLLDYVDELIDPASSSEEAVYIRNLLADYPFIQTIAEEYIVLSRGT